MNAEFRWIKIKTTEGHVVINVETVSHVSRVGAGYALRMTSGHLHLMTKKDGEKVIKNIIGDIKL